MRWTDGVAILLVAVGALVVGAFVGQAVSGRDGRKSRPYLGVMAVVTLLLGIGLILFQDSVVVTSAARARFAWLHRTSVVVGVGGIVTTMLGLTLSILATLRVVRRGLAWILDRAFPRAAVPTATVIRDEDARRR